MPSWSVTVSEHPGSDSDPPIGSDRRRGVTSLVVSEPRFRRFWKSLGLGGSGIEYMIEKPMLVMCWTDVDVLVFSIGGSS